MLPMHFPLYPDADFEKRWVTLTYGCVGEDYERIDVVEPLDAEAALFVLPFLEHDLDISGFEPMIRCHLGSNEGRTEGTYSFEKFARWRMRVTAAES